MGGTRFVLRLPMHDADRRLSGPMVGAGIAARGDPNSGGLPRWPAYDAKTGPYLEFGDWIAAGQGYRTTCLDFVQGLLVGRLCR